MNKFNFLLIIFIITLTAVEAQQHPMRPGRGFGGQNRLEQLEKLKMIEELGFDEETSIRFFTRRRAHMENQRELGNQREKALVDLWELTNEEAKENLDKKFNSKMKLVFEIEEKMVLERKEFFASLNDILSTEEIAKVMAFEGRFKREIWKSLMDRRKDIPPMN